jgi:hypothetical protein
MTDREPKVLEPVMVVTELKDKKKRKRRSKTKEEKKESKKYGFTREYREILFEFI